MNARSGGAGAPRAAEAPGRANASPEVDPLVELARRRARLLARSARLREELAADGAVIGRQVGTADRTLRFARRRLAGPALAVGAVALVVAGPSRVLGLLGRALVLWPVLRPLVGPAGRGALRTLAPLVAGWLARRRA